MATIILGHIGSDAGYWVIGPDGKMHHVGGWQVVDPEPWMLDLKAPRPIEEQTDHPTPNQPDEMESDCLV